jgi:hypothetical protein
MNDDKKNKTGTPTPMSSKTPTTGVIAQREKGIVEGRNQALSPFSSHEEASTEQSQQTGPGTGHGTGKRKLIRGLLIGGLAATGAASTAGILHRQNSDNTLGLSSDPTLPPTTAPTTFLEYELPATDKCGPNGVPFGTEVTEYGFVKVSTIKFPESKITDHGSSGENTATFIFTNIPQGQNLPFSLMIPLCKVNCGTLGDIIDDPFWTPPFSITNGCKVAITINNPEADSPAQPLITVVWTNADNESSQQTLMYEPTFNEAYLPKFDYEVQIYSYPNGGSPWEACINAVSTTRMLMPTETKNITMMGQKNLKSSQSTTTKRLNNN